ncbi:MAG: hypothetical protein ACK4ZI_03680, partial [Microcystis sp.]|uniref:hypothetical protein n=1 Tax=Microcystis sp. TaxID=1127 RepID=UPI003918B7F7
MPRGLVLWVLGDRRLRVSIQEIIFVYSSHTPHPTPHTLHPTPLIDNGDYRLNKNYYFPVSLVNS